MAIEERLAAFLKDARDWERRATNIPGVFLLKLPSSRTRQGAVAIEVNPVDAAGSATKKRGIVIRSASELNEFNRILGNQKLVELASKVDEVNPKQKETRLLPLMSFKFRSHHYFLKVHRIRYVPAEAPIGDRSEIYRSVLDYVCSSYG